MLCFRALWLLWFIGYVCACSRPFEQQETFSFDQEADSVRLRQIADSLVKAAETDTLRAGDLLAQAQRHLAAARQKERWVEVWGKRFRLHSKRKEYASLCAELEEGVRQMWWEEDHLSGRVYLLLGYCLRQVGRNYAAGVYYEKARLLSERFGNVTQRNPAGPIYKTLANIKTRLGENEEAEKLFSAALDLLRRDTAKAQAADNAFTAADVHNDLGIAYRNAGLLHRALQEYDRGLTQLRNLRLSNAADSTRLRNTRGLLLTNKAATLTDVGRLAEAAQTVENALQELMSDKVNYRFNALVAQAAVQEKMARPAVAQAIRQQALLLADRHSTEVERREVSKLLIAMGWAHLRQGAFDSAALLAQRALKRLFPHLPEADVAANPKPELFDLDPENAVAEALDLKGEALWQQFVRQGDPSFLALADSATRLAIGMMESLREVAVYESSRLLSSQQSRRLFGRHFRILYAHSQAGRADAAEHAFLCSEQSKAALLRQKVSTDVLLQSVNVDDSTTLRERDLRDQRAFLRNQLFQHLNRTPSAEDDSTARMLRQQIFFVEQQQRQLRQSIAEKYRLRLNRTAVPLLSAAEVRQRLLRPGEIWVGYFTDTDSGWVYLIAITPQHTNLWRRPYSESDVRAFIQLINDVQTAENRSADPQLWGDFVRQAHALYNTLLAPALSRFHPGRLTLSPDGALMLLPFDALLTQAADFNGRVDYAALPYLGTHIPIRLSLSASLEHFYVEHPSRRPIRSYVGLAPQYAGGRLTPIRGGKHLVLDAARDLKGYAFVGSQAQIDTFFRYAPRSAVLHFYGHAEALDTLPDYSWMAFSSIALPVGSPGESPTRSGSLGAPLALRNRAEGGHFLFAHQIYHTWLEADVVLLSACRTGIGRIAPGEGPLSLARAFQAAGCPATVMSLWAVRDDATAWLTRDFLENLRKGLDKDEALFLAKRRYCREGPDPFPYFWAGFALMGTPDPVRFSGGYLTIATYIFAGLFAVLAGWWFFLIRKKSTLLR